MAGHSRRCAQLAADAAQLGFADDVIVTLRRAALVHEFGTTAVPNSIWDKPGPLTRAEFDRVELHPMLTEQRVRLPQGPASRCRRSGRARPRCRRHLRRTHHRPRRPSRILRQRRRNRASPARITRRARSRRDRRRAGAAGHRQPLPKSRRPQHPGGLTGREAEVLRLVARSLTTREIADRLYISAKTADYHIQHVYTKIGVSTRAAAALWAMQHALAG